MQLCVSLVPDIDPATVHAILGQMNYPNDEEGDAKMFANMLMLAAAEAGCDDSICAVCFLAETTDTVPASIA
jgi:hypothetical protein